MRDGEEKEKSWGDEEEKRKKGGKGVFTHNRVDGLRIHFYLITRAIYMDVCHHYVNANVSMYEVEVQVEVEEK